MPSHEIIGRTCQELVQFMPNPVADSHFMQILENPWHTTDLAIGDRWFHVTVNLVLDESGNPSGAVYVMSDITERKWVEEEIKKLNQDLEYHVIERTAQLEAANQELEKEIIHRKRIGAALRESQQMLQFVMDNIPQFIFWKDRNSVFLGCNRNYAQLVGVGSPENIVGKTDYDLSWKKEEANFFRKCDRRVMETNTPEYHIIEPALRADGKQVWLDTNKVPLHDPEGNVVGILGTFEDITERKQAEAALSESQRKLATLIDSLPGIVFSCTNDSERALTYLSEGCLTLTGYTSEELVANGLIPYNSIIHAEDLPKLLNAIKTAIALKKPYVVEYRIRAKSGKEKWLWEKGSGIFDGNGEVLGLEGFITDITDRKRAEAALSESKKHLEDQNTVLMELARRKTLSLGDLNAAVREITEAATNTLGIERTSVWLYNNERSQIQCIDLYEWSKSRHSQGIELAAVDYPAYFQALQEERMIAAHDAHTDPRTKEFSQFYLSPLSITSMLDAPIWLNGEMVGVVCHEHVGTTREWALEEQNFAGSIADLVSMAMEVCDRKRTEAARSQLAAIVESSNEAIISKTLEGIVVSWNTGAERIFGYSAKEVKGCSISTMFPPERSNEEAQILQRIKQGERIEHYETVRVRKDGKPIHVSLSISPVKDATGNIIGISKIGCDITQRKRAEEELAKRDRYLTALVEVQRSLLTSHGSGDLYTKILESLGQAAGASRVYLFENHQDAVGSLLMSHRAEWCNQGIHPEIDNPTLHNLSYDDFFPRWTQKLARGEIIAGIVAEFPESERMILMPQGILSILILPLMVNGQFFGFIGFDNCLEAHAWQPLEVNLLAAAAAAISLTHEHKQAEEALQKSEEKYRSFIETTEEWIWSIDREGHYTYSNPAVEAILGYRVEEFVGRDSRLLMHAEDQKAIAKLLPSLIADKCGWTGFILRWRHKNGTYRYLESNAVPVFNDRNEVVGYRGADRDITDRKQAEEKIKASLKEKEVLLKEIHHRVKNNLQIISSLLKLQSSYIKDQQALEMFKDSQSRIRSMALIHEKLYQSQDLSKVNFAEYIANLAANLFRSYTINSTAINLSMNVDDVFLEIDIAVPCGLILNELISNSLKYAFPDERKGKIQIDLSLDKEREVTLIVKDDGIGLPKDFDFHNTKTLGLQLVDNLVEQLEGTIELNGNGRTECKITFTISD